MGMGKLREIAVNTLVLQIKRAQITICTCDARYNKSAGNLCVVLSCYFARFSIERPIFRNTIFLLSKDLNIDDLHSSYIIYCSNRVVVAVTFKISKK